MIELPEGLVLAKQLDDALRGKQIVHAAANASPHKFAWYAGDPAGYDALLTGRTVEDAYSYGGKVHVRLSGGRRSDVLRGRLAPVLPRRIGAA